MKGPEEAKVLGFSHTSAGVYWKFLRIDKLIEQVKMSSKKRY
jgi:hypothetical protein